MFTMKASKWSAQVTFHFDYRYNYYLDICVADYQIINLRLEDCCLSSRQKRNSRALLKNHRFLKSLYFILHYDHFAIQLRFCVTICATSEEDEQTNV